METYAVVIYYFTVGYFPPVLWRTTSLHDFLWLEAARLSDSYPNWGAQHLLTANSTRLLLISSSSSSCRTRSAQCRFCPAFSLHPAKIISSLCTCSSIYVCARIRAHTDTRCMRRSLEHYIIHSRLWKGRNNPSFAEARHIVGGCVGDRHRLNEVIKTATGPHHRSASNLFIFKLPGSTHAEAGNKPLATTSAAEARTRPLWIIMPELCRFRGKAAGCITRTNGSRRRYV